MIAQKINVLTKTKQLVKQKAYKVSVFRGKGRDEKKKDNE